MSDLITPKEFLQNKYKYYKKHWNEHEVINDEFIVGEMQAYSDYVQSQANGDNKEQDKALRLPDVVQQRELFIAFLTAYEKYLTGMDICKTDLDFIDDYIKGN